MTALDIAYFVHGRGRGHASRSLPIARRLASRGHQVNVYGGGDASDLSGEAAQWHPRAPLVPGVKGFVGLPTRIVSDALLLGRSGPDLVVSDGDPSALVAARARGIAGLTIGHDLVFSSCALPSSLSRVAMSYEYASVALSTHFAVRRVAVHFLPIEPSRPNTWVARPDGDRDVSAVDGGHFVAYFRDANGSEVVQWLRARGHEVHWYGPGATAPDGAPSPFVDRARFQHELRTAAGVIGSAGSNLLAECVLHQKPVLALYRRGDTEQQLNADLVVAAQVAMASRIDRATPSLVERFAARVQRGDFAQVDLAEHLRPVSDVVEELVG